MIKISIVMGYRLRQNKNIFRKKHTESYIRLINSLDSLRKQTFSKDEYEIILVDYGSTVPIKNYIKTLYPFVKVIYTDEKESFNEYKAKNIGIKQSKGKFIVCVNADIVFQNNFLQVVYDTLVNNPYAFVLCRRYNLPRAFVNKTKNLVENLTNIIKKNNIQYDYDGKANVGDCQGLPKHIFKIIRGYDEDFEGWGWGDEDFAARIKRMGLKEIWIEDKTSIFHQGHKVNKKRKVKDAAHHQKLMIEKYKKHKLSVIRNTETDWGKIK